MKQKNDKFKEKSNKKKEKEVAKENALPKPKKKLLRRRKKDYEDWVGDDVKEDFTMLSTDAQGKIKETNRGLDQLSGLVADMKDMAIGIGDTLDEQNDDLKVLKRGIQRTGDKTKKSDRRVKKAMS